MKKLWLFLLLSLFTFALFAQTPKAEPCKDGCDTELVYSESGHILLADASLQIQGEAPLPIEIDVTKEDAVVAAKDTWAIVLDIISNNWELILSGLAYILYRFIPTKKADIIISLISWLWNTLLPDRKKGGGTHSI